MEEAGVDESATIGYKYSESSNPPVFGDNPVVRAGTIIYNDVIVGDQFATGHNALVRERTDIGDSVLVGTNTVIDGYSKIGSNVSLQTGVYVPSNTTIGDDVFLGPHAVLTNDPYPIREQSDLTGPTVENNVSIGANATVLPDVTVGSGSFVAAGAVVVKDVPDNILAIGVPAKYRPLPTSLQGQNDI